MLVLVNACDFLRTSAIASAIASASAISRTSITITSLLLLVVFVASSIACAVCNYFLVIVQIEVQ